MDLKNILRQLCETAGVSGDEARIRKVVRDVWRPFTDSIESDRVGNVIGIKTGLGEEPRPRILLAAHMDEIGLMVNKLIRFPDEPGGSGFLAVTQVGGVDRRHLYGQTVTVHGTGREGRDLMGIIGALPEHMLPPGKRNKPLEFDDMVVDVGMSFEALTGAIEVGDFISFNRSFRELLNGRVTSKALDNRSSVLAVAVCLEFLMTRQHKWDVIAVATTQEETVLLGGFTSAYSLKPDIALAIDVTFAKGPGTSDDFAHELDKGPAIEFGPNVHPGIYGELREAAKRLEMNVALSPHSRIPGTDAYGLQIAREGIPTGLIGIPLRYMHTMVESMAIADIKRSGRLMGEFIAHLDESFLGKIAIEMMED